jgi:cytochrome c oxidase cbb3-type subunit 3
VTFVSSGWSWWVIAITVGGLVFCVWLLFVSSRTTQMSDDGTTGHVWDENLREMNNPLPRWWLWLFIITVVFAGLYLYLYPGLGTSAEGSLKWTSSGQLAAEKEAANAKLQPVFARYVAMDAAQLAQESEAMAMGQRLFINNCAQCHGSDGRGSKGFPNLADQDWLWGGEFETIKQTITNGREGMMPPMAAAVGSADEQRNLAHYVLSLSGSAHDSLKAQLGKGKFGACAACHGAPGQGQSGPGRAESDRQDLAARLGRAGHPGHDCQRQAQRDAGAEQAAHARADPRVGGLRQATRQQDPVSAH